MKKILNKCFWCERHTENNPEEIIDGNQKKKSVRFCDHCKKAEQQFVDLSSSMTQSHYDQFIKDTNQFIKENDKELCKHEWGSEELCDSSNPYYICNKCGKRLYFDK